MRSPRTGKALILGRLIRSTLHGSIALDLGEGLQASQTYQHHVAKHCQHTRHRIAGIVAMTLINVSDQLRVLALTVKFGLELVLLAGAGVLVW
ncbi:hypothetical protein JT358_10450 [Micrococcales bacterium 31B]|nr:hypothetical protein [Micrococcales bacterium 31B]